MTAFHVSEIWRYPVKSMRGERLEAVEVTKGGIPFDRGWAVRDEKTQTIRGAKHLAGLMQCSARYLEGTDAGPVPHAEITLPSGDAVNTDDPKAAKAVSEVVGREVTLWPLQPKDNDDHYKLKALEKEDFEQELRFIFALEEGEPMPDLSGIPQDLLEEVTAYASPRGTYFDLFPINVLTEASLRHFASLLPEAQIDVRRFRPNFLVADDGGLSETVEEGWVGKMVGLGTTELAILLKTMRCVMTTREQADLPRVPQIMRTLVRELDHCLAVYATVGKEGRVTVGDPVTVGG
ncbi:MAG: MOSC N-terminal beta barrel domain-containing protein [Pseudomonadota bacterium]